MESIPFQRLGNAPYSGWDVYSLSVPNPKSFPESLSISSTKFVCLLSWNARNVSVEIISDVAESLLKLGCIYFCCWGQDCERVHDIVDEVIVGNDTPNIARIDIMTTWHEEESLEDAIDFFLNSACPADRHINECSAAVAITIGNEYEVARMEMTLLSKLLQPPSNSPHQGARRKDIPS